jgi:serine/threonine protein kinase
VLANIAKRLEAMHKAGYAHRDLKPANVMWLPRENQWTLIDFGCAARVGQEAPLSFTLAYAAPETVRVWREGHRTCISSEALDAWSLGVMVYELLIGQPAFNVFIQGRDSVRSCSPCHALCTRPMAIV